VRLRRLAVRRLHRADLARSGLRLRVRRRQATFYLAGNGSTPISFHPSNGNQSADNSARCAGAHYPRCLYIARRVGERMQQPQLGNQARGSVTDWRRKVLEVLKVEARKINCFALHRAAKGSRHELTWCLPSDNLQL
jgi:hypothetical protein